MNIVREDREDRSALLKVTVSESDYAEEVDNTLKEYRKKANIPGFRPGKVPMGVVKRMYLKSVVAEQAYKTASQAAFDYIEKEKINHIGDVMPSQEQGELDFDNSKEHQFVFEVGLSPELNLELTKKDKVTKYTIKGDDKMYEGYRSNFMRKFGRLEDVEVVESDEALTVTLDNDDMNIEDAYVGLVSMSEEERKPFIGKKVGETMDVDVNELYKTERQRAAILQVDEEELANINPKFKLTITQIRKFAEPEINDEFFAMAFPDGTVKDEEALETFLHDQVAKDLNRETDYIYTVEMRNMMLGKANPEMPEEFLKRWIFAINEGKFSQEQIDADFPEFLGQMKWNIIQKHFVEELEIKVEEAEAINEAKEYAMMQFAQYGMTQVADDMLENYAGQILSNKEEARKIFDRLYENKVIEAVSPKITIEEKEVTVDEFTKIAQKLVNPEAALALEQEEKEAVK